ncbi:MAG TPA: Hsp70 family protein, partial [Tessaracoccus flavescens]|nr:Hsp70 family protein [Tessaracoccus flavescens]
DIDANGIVHVNAKDLATGKEQSMTVTGGSALNKDDIERMVKDAEAHAEDDRQRREAVEMRNEGDALVFRTEKLLAEHADTIGDDVKAPVVEATEALKEALKGEDNDAVKAAIDDLNTKAASMGQAIYAAAQAKAQESAPADDTVDGETSADAGAESDVVDAEIVEEDKEDK